MKFSYSNSWAAGLEQVRAPLRRGRPDERIRLARGQRLAGGVLVRTEALGRRAGGASRDLRHSGAARETAPPALRNRSRGFSAPGPFPPGSRLFGCPPPTPRTAMTLNCLYGRRPQHAESILIGCFAVMQWTITGHDSQYLSMHDSPWLSRL